MSTNLLERAAWAAGYTDEKDGIVGLALPHGGWNPLTSDGDAFRLMVDAQVEVRCYSGTVEAVYQDDDGGDRDMYIYMEHGTDKYATVRRAIVRAAAASYVEDYVEDEE